jgi:hypothetical protein
MCSGVVELNGLIVTAPNDFLVQHEHCPNRHLSFGLRSGCFGKSFGHPERVVTSQQVAYLF